MSVRPRPVTAKIRPPEVSPSRLKKPRNTLSDGSSTESLVSILDHDSCDSIPESEGEQPAVLDKPTVMPRKTSSASSRSSRPSRTVTTRSTTKTTSTCSSTSSHTTSHTTPPPPKTPTQEDKLADPSPGEVSPWEKWLLRKTRELRLKQEQVLQAESVRAQEEKKQREKKRDLHRRAREKFLEWKAQKELEAAEKRKLDSMKQDTDREIKEQNKKKLDQECEVKYKEWLAKKRQVQRRQRQEAEEAQRREEAEKQEQRQRSQQAYERWREEADQRPRSVPASFGYSCGKLTGFHDRNAYPTPSFYNPIPWQPIKVASQSNNKKKIKKKVRSKYKFNPDKYL